MKLKLSLFVFLINLSISAQSLTLPLIITDNDGGIDTLHFGLNQNATNNLDAALGEVPLPPLPPTGIFDARFNLPDGNASLIDLRQGNASSVVEFVYSMQFQAGTGSTMTFYWDLPTGVTGNLSDLLGGILVDEVMSGKGDYTLTNLALDKLQMTINYTGTEVNPVASSYQVKSSRYSVEAGDTVLLSAQLLDADGEPFKEESRSITWSSPNGGLFSNNPTLTDANGHSTVVFTTANDPEKEYVITVEDGELLTGTAEKIVTFKTTDPGDDQKPNLKYSLVIDDNDGGMDTLYFGINPKGTDLIDSELDEVPLPPLPPSGIFDARFTLDNGDASLIDIRNGDSSFVGQIEYTLEFQPGTGTEMNFSWDLPSGVSGKLQDQFGGILIDVEVSGQNNYTLTNLNLNALNLIIDYDFGAIAQNSAPVIESIGDQITNEDSVISVTVNFNDSDIGDSHSIGVELTDSSIIKVGAISGNVSGSTIEFIPVENAHGETNVKITVSDGVDTDVVEFKLTINAVNDAPELIKGIPDAIFAEDSGEQIHIANLSDYFSDIDLNDELSFSLIQDSSFAQIADNQKIVVHSAENYFGVSNVIVFCTDLGNLSAVDTFSIQITPVNDKPIIEIENIELNENDSTTINLSDFIYDVDNLFSELIIDVQPISQLFWLNFNTNNLTVKIGTDSEISGKGAFIVTVSDPSQALSVDTVFVNVNSINDKPFFGTPPVIEFDEDQTFLVTAGFLSQFIFDPDNIFSELTLDLKYTGVNVQVIYESVDTAIVQPAENWFGEDSLMVIVFDGEYYDSLSIKFKVLPINDLPFFKNLPDSVIQFSSEKDSITLN
ncbi:MAG: tandem-95 repeat protein, partial [Melioribacteraceae bacterium]|nr:tandem-95 repeat protein [Melioribacteraceae bacterium]